MHIKSEIERSTVQVKYATDVTLLQARLQQQRVSLSENASVVEPDLSALVADRKYQRRASMPAQHK